MLNYILQIIFFQTLFFVVYELLLKKETFFTGNRVYLIATQALVLILPFFRFPTIQNAIPIKYQNVYTKNYYDINETVNVSTTLSENNYWSFSWEWLLYFGGLISLFLFFNKLIRLWKILKTGNKRKLNKFNLVTLNDDSTAFSFYNYIFIGKHISAQKRQEIIAHEQIHIQQKHSLDLLFFELLRITFWFNPLIYLYQKRITEVHEFIVDKELTNTTIKKEQYFNRLLSDVFQTQQVSFTNSFYKASLIKKRIQMLTKMKSKDRQRLKYFFIAPILAIAVSFVACNENSKQLAVLMDSTNWYTTNYETGDAIKVFQYMPQIQNNGNSLNIKNLNSKKDAVVKLIENDTDTMFRDVYIKRGEIASLKNIPIGRYYLKITLGNNWEEACINGECLGQFKKNEEFQKLFFEHLLELKSRETIYSNRSYRSSKSISIK